MTTLSHSLNITHRYSRKTITQALTLFVSLCLPMCLVAEIPAALVEIPQSRMSATASSFTSGLPPANAIDGNVGTVWITTVTGEQWLQIDLGYPHTISAIEVYSSYERIRQYKVYIANEPNPADWGVAVAEGELPNSTAYHPVVFGYTHGRYLRLVAVSRWGSQVRVNNLRIHGSAFLLANKETANTAFTHSNTVDVVGLPVMTGYDRYQITDSNLLPTAGWLAYDPETLPTGLEIDLGSPAEGETMTRYAWFKDDALAVKPTTNAPASITYVNASADVAAMAVSTFSVPSWGEANPAVIRLSDIENGSSSSIGIFSYALSVDPADDLTPGDPHTITLNATGSYTNTLTVTDYAGNTASDTTALTVFAGAAAQETTWTGALDGQEWFEHKNWNNYIPGPGAIVTVNAGANILLSAPTPALGTFTMNGGTLTLTGWNTCLNAVEMTIAGTVTHPAQSATAAVGGIWIPDNRVWIVCTNLTLSATGKIDVDYKGYQGAIAAISGYSAKGYGPGGGSGGTYSSGGAGYGGAGGIGDDNIQGGVVYGDAANPTDPGSSSGAAQMSNGSPGGGVVRVEAGGSVVLDGSVLASGESRGGYPGAGSGGGVYIGCRTFKGSGSITAAGGNDTRNVRTRMGGAGGGGRIAVVYDTDAQAAVSPQPAVFFNAAGGSRTAATSTIDLGRRSQGRPGTLFLSDDCFFDMTHARGGEIHVPGLTSLTTNTLALATGGIGFLPGFTLTVTEDLTISGAGSLEMTNSVLTVGRSLIINSDRRSGLMFRGGPDQTVSIGSNMAVTKGWIDFNAQGISLPELAVPGDLTLNEANVYLNDQPYTTSGLNVGGDLSASNGALLYLNSAISVDPTNAPSILVDVAGTLSLGANCWIYPASHPTNGGSVFFQVGQFTVQSGGGINANENGFWGGQRQTVNNPPGYGPGHGFGRFGNSSSGGGYGGRGGHAVASQGGATNAVGGSVYGVVNAPVEPGSGAGGTYTSGFGGPGGGLIHVQASGSVLMDGSLLANGGVGNSYAGSGSGGGIYVACKQFTGSGLLRANGASRAVGQGNAGTGGGGGGRIAVRYGVPYTAPSARLVITDAPATFSGTAEALGGTGKYDPDNRGDNGTVRFVQALAPGGTLLLLR